MNTRLTVAIIVLTLGLAVAAPAYAVDYTITINIIGQGTVTKSPDQASYISTGPLTDLVCSDHTGPTYTVTSATGGFTGFAGYYMAFTKQGTDDHFRTSSIKIISVTDDNTIELEADPTDGTNATAGYGGAGIRVTITSTPDPGYVFAGWYGDLQSCTNGMTTTITITSDINATVRFNAIGSMPPTLPTSELDTTYSLPTGGNIIPVNQGENLQTAINNAQPGDVLVLQAGATFTGPFDFPTKSGDGCIYVVSSELDQLSEGKRVGPGDAVHMPKIVAPYSWTPAIYVNPSAHNYRFAGIEITTAYDQRDSMQYGLVLLGLDRYGAEASTWDTLADNIILDRVYLHGTATGNNRDGLLTRARRFAVIDSYISEFHGSESHGIQIFYGAGPITIENNFIEAAGINLFIGDNVVRNYDLQPQDITVRGNYLYKPLNWRTWDPDYIGIHWSVKNLFEIKCARRVLFENNVLENNWADGQNGTAVLLTPRGGPIEDITFRKNIVRNSGRGFNLSPADVSLNRILMADNLVYEIGDGTTNMLWGGVFFYMESNRLRCYANLAIGHNTWLFKDGAGYANGFFSSGKVLTPDVIDGVVFKNNLMDRGYYGIANNGLGEGWNGVDYYLGNYSVDTNVLIGIPYNVSWYADRVPDYVNFHLESAWSDIGFASATPTNPADFALSSNSKYYHAGTDGKDIGADIAALLLATAHTIDGDMTQSTIEGDVNRDGKVDIKDLILVAKDFGKTSGFNPGCDLNIDGRVDIRDVIIVARNYGK